MRSRFTSFIKQVTSIIIKRDKNVGLYVTVGVHLIALIILLSLSIHTAIKTESTFIFDFSKEEELAALEEEARLKEEVSKEIDALLAEANIGAPLPDIRNAAVDRSQNRSETNQLEEPSSDIASDSHETIDEYSYAEPIEEKPEEEKETYSGPSVVSYDLGGRKAIYLPVPAYRCQGGGDVRVNILVTQKGYVKSASINETGSSTDRCLRKYALRAAKKSRFKLSNDSENTVGEIIYKFIAQ